MAKSITRRQSIIYAAAGSLATAAVLGGLNEKPFCQSSEAAYPKPAMLPNPESPTVLVAYGTRAGSTMEIAAAIALALENRNFKIHLCPVQEAAGPKEYSYIVIGSAIRMGSPLPEVVQYIEKHQTEFAGRPLACFAVHLTNEQDDAISRQKRSAYLDPIRKLLNLNHEGYFTGVYNPAKLPFLEVLMGKLMKSPVGDFRDWNAIRAWGESIFPQESASVLNSRFVTAES